MQAIFRCRWILLCFLIVSPLFLITYARGFGSSISRPSISRPSISRPSISRPSISRPSLSRPSLSRPSLSRPSLSRPSPSHSRGPTLPFSGRVQNPRPWFNPQPPPPRFIIPSSSSHVSRPSLSRPPVFPLSGRVPASEPRFLPSSNSRGTRNGLELPPSILKLTSSSRAVVPKPANKPNFKNTNFGHGTQIKKKKHDLDFDLNFDPDNDVPGEQPPLQSNDGFLIPNIPIGSFIPRQSSSQHSNGLTGSLPSAVCEDDCQHGGKCVAPGVCQCPGEYRGRQCQFHFLKCDILNLIKEENFSWVCKHNKEETVCHLRCKSLTRFNSSTAVKYRCMPDGKWESYTLPDCDVHKS